MPIYVIVILVIFLASAAYAGFQGAPWVPTRKKDVERFLALVRIQPGQKMYDLGCGDGRMICAAARAGVVARGLELSLFPFILAHIRRLFQKNRRQISISYKNIWKTNLADADIVYFFLMPEIYPRLKAKFERELKRETQVIAYVWPIPGWTPARIDDVAGRSKLYLYVV